MARCRPVRSLGFSGPVPVGGWLFICQPRLSRNADLVLRELDVIAAQFDSRAVDLVRRRLVAVLGTASGDAPASARLKARLAGQPYDEHRMQLLNALVKTLDHTAPIPVPEVLAAPRWQWLAFFVLREHHAILLAARPDKRPGLFKANPDGRPMIPASARAWRAGRSPIRPQISAGRAGEAQPPGSWLERERQALPGTEIAQSAAAADADRRGGPRAAADPHRVVRDTQGDHVVAVEDGEFERAEAPRPERI